MQKNKKWKTEWKKSVFFMVQILNICFLYQEKEFDTLKKRKEEKV